MDQVFVFSKSYKERLQEYQSVLGGHDFLPVSKLKKEWSYYLQLTIEPKGWKAIWKIPRMRCEELGIDFPTIVLVHVESINFSELTACVELLALQSDISLSSNHKVSLVQLWVSKDQDECSYIELTANALDMLQFFYIYLLFPWDYKDNPTIDWVNNHLESRLQLYYDMKDGIMPRQANERLKWLLNKARRLHAFCENTEFQSCANESIKDNLLEAQMELLKVHTEVKLLESPLLRNVYLEKFSKATFVNPAFMAVQNWLVFDKSSMCNYLKILEKVRDAIGNKTIYTVAKFSNAIESANTGDTILLNKDIHRVIDTAGLPTSVILKGLSRTRTDIILRNERTGAMLDCFGNVMLENLTIDVNAGQCGIVIRNGTTTIRNCRIIGNNKTPSHHGVVLLPGSTLCMIECEIDGFYVGLFGNSETNITIKNCIISDAVIGLQIFDGCCTNIDGLTLNLCQQFGVYIDTNTILQEACYQKGHFSLLERVPNMMAKNTSGASIGKAQVIILHSTKHLLIHDLFNASALNTVSINEDLERELGSDITCIETPIILSN